MDVKQLQSTANVFLICGMAVMVSAVTTLQHSRPLGIFLCGLCVALEVTAAYLYGTASRRSRSSASREAAADVAGADETGADETRAR